MLKQLLAAAGVFTAAFSFSQTFNGGGGPIQDLQTFEYAIDVSGLPGSIQTTGFGLERICVNATHTWDADVTLMIIAPDGSTATLISGIGGDGDNLQGTCFQWDASVSIVSGWAPFTGDFRPLEEIGVVNNGQDPNGTWRLRVYDGAWGDEGAVTDWSLTFGNNPADFFQFTESNLPIVVLNTGGNPIPDDPKIEAHMGIIDNGPGVTNHLTDPFNAYNDLIGIEQRGSSSATFPQKSYGFETRDVNGTDHDAILLGMPNEKDWILYAPYNDKTCLRNILSYDIANKTGHYASRTKLCELVLNGQYKGIYVLMEKIKRDPERVDIAKLLPTDIDGDELTGGYIVKVDRTDGPGSFWTSDFQTSAGTPVNFVYVDPKADEIVPQQAEYIRQYIGQFETTLSGPDFADPATGYRSLIDVPSFVDYLLLNEASKNVDGYRLSAFLYKDKNSNGGKLNAGPAWDYNLAWWNADYCEGSTTTGWAYAFNDICGGDYDVPFWWERLLEDDAFRRDVKCRWTELRQGVLSLPQVYHVIDSVAALIDEAQTRHFTVWPILGVYTWPNPSPLPTTFAEEITSIKTWIEARFEWMDASLGACDLATDELFLTGEQVETFPNPFDEGFSVRFYLPADAEIRIRLTDMLGQTVTTLPQTQFHAGENKLNIDVSAEGLKSGLYLLEIETGSRKLVKRLMKNGN